ncbi:MAG: dephospho-CoA kinase [Planctomycetota bacterium]|nr:dephospho-CoA kinase [Planctomycetota bacterium]
MVKDYCAPVVGLVGGIGSGKSALAGWVSQNAPVEVIDGDQLGHQALQDPTLARTVLARFPQAQAPQDTNDIDHPSVDRKALAQIVFGSDHLSQTARNDLEAIVHPFIHRRLQDLIREHHNRNDCEAILVDAAVLFEAGWDQLCDHVVFVDVPQALRLTRVATTRNWTQADYLARQSSQWPLEKKQDTADNSVDNSGSLEESGASLLSLIHSLRGKTSASCP